MAKRIRVEASSPCCPLVETRTLDKHPNKLLEGLNRLRLIGVFCDVVLCCEGQEFPCHRVVLASISSYFEAMFTTGMLESTQERVNMDGVEAEVVDMLVSFAYTSELSVSTANVQVLLAGANLMDVTDVREACCDYIESHMNIHNCVEIHLLADKYSCQQLERSSMDYMLEYFSVIYKQEEFLSVSVDKLTAILSSDHLNVPEEDMVFDAAILWLNTCPDRRQTFDKVLEHVRLPLIGPSHLHTVTEALDVMKEVQGCQSFISEARTYQRLIAQAEDQPLLSYRDTARPRRTTVILMVGRLAFTSFDGVESFDLRTTRWKDLTSLRTAGKGPSIVASGSLLYEAGGRNRDGSFSKELWRCDLNRVKWLQMAPMNEARCGCGLVMLDVYLFALGGLQEPNNTSEKSVERHDPNTNTWQLVESVNMPDFDYGDTAMVALDGLIYVIGGVKSQNGRLTPLYKYNPSTGEWTEVAPTLIPRAGLAACTLRGKIYVLGGVDPSKVAGFTSLLGGTHAVRSMDKVERYDPKTDQWTMCAPMQHRRYSPHVAVMDGMIYVLGGGEDGRSPCNIERYREETNTWQTVGQMPEDCYGRYSSSCLFVRLRTEAPTASTHS